MFQKMAKMRANGHGRHVGRQNRAIILNVHFVFVKNKNYHHSF